MGKSTDQKENLVGNGTAVTYVDFYSFFLVLAITLALCRPGNALCLSCPRPKERTPGRRTPASQNRQLQRSEYEGNEFFCSL